MKKLFLFLFIVIAFISFRSQADYAQTPNLQPRFFPWGGYQNQLFYGVPPAIYGYNGYYNQCLQVRWFTVHQYGCGIQWVHNWWTGAQPVTVCGTYAWNTYRLVNVCGAPGYYPPPHPGYRPGYYPPPPPRPHYPPHHPHRRW